VGDTTNATDDILGPSRNVSGCLQDGSDVWFALSVNQDSTVVISTCSNVTSFDTLLDVFVNTSGSHPVPTRCGTLDLIACNDDSLSCPENTENDFVSSVTLVAAAGTHYLIRVGSFTELDFGPFELSITPASGPSPPPSQTPSPSQSSPTPGTAGGNSTLQV
jgi:hypothetical protein